MQIWQKDWLVILLIFFSFHTIRDVLQRSGSKAFIATFLTKKDTLKVPTWYWKVFNEYLFELFIIILSLYCLLTNSFGFYGYLTLILAGSFEIIWLVYWFFL